MDYQYLQANQIKNLDYWSLVNMLSTQISPETRTIILERLTYMNQQLLMGSSLNIQTDLSRAGMLNSKKKDITEQQHPSMDRLNYKGQNPLPLNIPMNASNTQYMPMNAFGQTNQINPVNPYLVSSQMSTPTPALLHPQPRQATQTPVINEIDLDDIIDDLNDEQQTDDLDDKLFKIKNLHHKIITDKRQRRKEREYRKQMTS